MENIKLVTTEKFYDVETSVYKDVNNEMYMTAKQLGECLEFAEPIIAINKLISRNEYIKDEEFSVVTKLVSTDGKCYDTRVFNEDGIYEITMLAKTPRAKEFRCWIRQLLKSLRRGELQLASGNATFTPELLQATIAQLLIPQQPNYWLWKKHISNPLIDTIANKLSLDNRTALDLLYNTMTSEYGFDKSFAINQFCTKYKLETATIIDSIADVPEYQRQFVDVANKLLNNQPAPVQPVSNVNRGNFEFKDMDKVQLAIQPLIQKYDDKSFNAAKTYGKVYALMTSKKGWILLMSRNNCTTKKQLILKREDLYKRFCKCVNALLTQEKGIKNAN